MRTLETKAAAVLKQNFYQEKIVSEKVVTIIAFRPITFLAQCARIIREASQFSAPPSELKVQNLNPVLWHV